MTRALASQSWHQSHSFKRNFPRHLAVPHRSVCEDDGYLCDPEAATHRQVCHFDLEDVAIGPQRGEVDRFEHRAPDALEAAGSDHAP